MTGPHEPDQPAGEPEVGSVGEEAAKLFGALSDWAKDNDGQSDGQSDGQGDGQAEGAPASAPASTFFGLAGQAAARLSAVNDHIATGAPECTFCPVCRTVHAIRGTSPEVRAHLADAASSFLQAVAGVLATVPPPHGESGETRQTGQPGQVQRIDLEGDDDDA